MSRQTSVLAARLLLLFILGSLLPQSALAIPNTIPPITPSIAAPLIPPSSTDIVDFSGTTSSLLQSPPLVQPSSSANVPSISRSSIPTDAHSTEPSIQDFNDVSQPYDDLNTPANSVFDGSFESRPEQVMLIRNSFPSLSVGAGSPDTSFGESFIINSESHDSIEVTYQLKTKVAFGIYGFESNLFIEIKPITTSGSANPEWIRAELASSLYDNFNMTEPETKRWTLNTRLFPENVPLMVRFGCHSFHTSGDDSSGYCGVLGLKTYNNIPGLWMNPLTTDGNYYNRPLFPMYVSFHSDTLGSITPMHGMFFGGHFEEDGIASDHPSQDLVINGPWVSFSFLDPLSVVESKALFAVSPSVSQCSHLPEISVHYKRLRDGKDTNLARNSSSNFDSSVLWNSTDTTVLNKSNLTGIGQIQIHINAYAMCMGSYNIAIDSLQILLNGQPINFGKSPIPQDQVAGKCYIDEGGHPNCYLGDPVNTYSGSFYLEHTDLSVLAAGPRLALQRRYSSLFADSSRFRAGAFGSGWRSALDTRLVLPDSGVGAEDDMIIYEAPSGNRYRFAIACETAACTAPTYMPAPGIYMRLDKQDANWIVSEPSHGVRTFAADGRLLQIADPQGRTQTFHYAAITPTHILSITDDLTARSIEVDYTPLGQVQAITTTAGLLPQQTVGFSYSTAGDLVGVTDVYGGLTTYTYDALHRLLTEILPEEPQPHITNTYDATTGRISSQTTSLSVTTTFSYTTDPISAHQLTTITTIQDGVPDTVIVHEYRSDGTLYSIQKNGHIESIGFFDESFTPSVTIDGSAHAQSTVQTPLGLPVTLHTTDQATSTIVYTATSLPMEVHLPGGQIVQYTYDNFYQPIQIVAIATTGERYTTTLTYTNDDYHLIQSRTSPVGLTTWFDYDNYGQLDTQVENYGTTAAVTATYAYDTAGRLATTTYGAGTAEAQAHHTVYAPNGEISQEYANWTWTGNDLPTPGSDENVLIARYGYDQQGRRIWVQRADDHYQEYTHYDASGRMDWAVQNPTDANGNSLLPTTLPIYTPIQPDANIVTLYSYDHLNRVTLITQTGILTGTFNPATQQFSDATARVTHIEYDDRSRPVTRTLNYQPDQPMDLLPDINVQSFTYYDGADHIIWERDTAGRWTYTEYDSLSRPVTTTINYENGDPLTVDSVNLPWTDGHDTDQIQVRRYTADGRLDTLISNYVDGIFDPAEPDRDHVTVMTYDGLGRMNTTISNYAPGLTGSDINLTTVTRYDAVTGLIQATQDIVGNWTVPQYDAAKRPTWSIQNCRDIQGNPAWTNCVPFPSRTDRSVPAGGGYEYDGLGRTVVTTDTLDLATHTAFDGLGRIITQTINYVPGEPTSPITNIQLITHYSDSLNTQITLTDASGATITRTQDILGRTVRMTDAVGLSTQTGYDGIGTSRWSRSAQGIYTVYFIDGLGRITSSIVNYIDGIHDSSDTVDQDIVTQTIFDIAGNVVEVQDTSGYRVQYVYDQQKQILSVLENIFDTSCTIIRTDCNILTHYTYDRTGNLLSTTDANNHTRTITYNALNQQVSKTDPLSATTTWEYGPGGQLLRVHDPRGSAYDTVMFYDELGHLTATLALSTTTLTPITQTYDLNGRITQTSDESGLTDYQYDRLGRVEAITTTQNGGSKTIGYGYDVRSQRTDLMYPSGTQIHYSYDQAGRMTVVEDDSTLLATYHYDPTTGYLDAMTTGDRLTTTYTYDALARPLTQQTHQATQPLVEFLYQWDLQGTPSVITETLPLMQQPEMVTAQRFDSSSALKESSSSPSTPQTVASVTSITMVNEEGANSFAVTAPGYTAHIDTQGVALTVANSRLKSDEQQVQFRVQQLQQGTTTIPLSTAGSHRLATVVPTVAIAHSAVLRETLAAEAAGIKHNLILDQPLAGSGDVVVTYQLRTRLLPQITAAQGVRFFKTGRGRATLLTPVELSPVVVYDAAGQRMTARITLQGTQLRATVPAAWLERATYPVTIDPLLGTAATLSSGTSAPQDAQIGWVATGYYMTLFTDTRDTALPRVYAQSFSVSGVRAGAPVLVSATTGALPAISDALTSTTVALGVWQTPSSGGTTLVGQRLDLYTGKVGTPITLTAGVTTTVRPQVVGHPGTQTYLVVWSDQADGAVRGQRVSSSGALVGSVITIFPTGTWDTTTQVTVHPTTQDYLVVSATSNDILAQRVSSSGALVGSATTVATPSTTPMRLVVAAASGTTGYLVAWDATAGVQTQRLTTAAAVTGTVGNPVGTTTGDPLPGQLVFNSSRQEWVLAWVNATTHAVLAQVLDLSAATVGSAWTIAGTTSAQVQDVRLALEPVWQRYGVIWPEQQSGVTRIQGATVSASTGSLTSGPLTIVDPRSLASRAVAGYAVDQDAYVVAWQDVQGATTATLRLRAVSGTGVPQGTITTLPLILTTTPAAPALAAGGTGEPLLLVWQEDGPSATATIRATRVSQSGTLLDSSPIAVSPTSAGLRQTPQVAYNPDAHEFLVVWTKNTTGFATVEGQRIGLDGTVLGSLLSIASSSGGNQLQVLYHPLQHEYLVTWIIWSTPIQRVYTQRVTAAGAPVGPIRWVSDAAAHPYDWLSLAALPGEPGYMVAWTDYNRTGAGLLSTWAHRLAADGQPVGTDIMLSPEVSGHWQTGATISADPAHAEYLVLWADNWSIYGQRLAGSGALEGGRILVAASPTVKVDPTLLERGTTGEQLLLWRAAEETTGYGIQAQRYQRVQAAFTATPILPAGTTVFTDTSTSPVTLTSWLWTFGDGITSTLQYPSHVYSPTGVYTVSLTVTSGGEWDTVTQAVTVPVELLQTVVTTYTHDGLNRLMGAERSTGAVYTYTYDLVGNRTGAWENGSGTTVSYNAADQVQGWSYDAAGNITNDGSQSYTWDALSRLTRVESLEQDPISYTYNGMGTLTAQTYQETTTQYIQDPLSGLSHILEVEKNGLSEQVLYGLQRIAQHDTTARTWLVSDRQGSERLAVDDAGIIHNLVSYDPWGQIEHGTAAPFGYTGELHEAVTGLQYLRARWYNPATGTLLGRDPFSGRQDQPRTQHPYAYAWNMPTTMADPTGQTAEAFSPCTSNYDCSGPWYECTDTHIGFWPVCQTQQDCQSARSDPRCAGYNRYVKDCMQQPVTPRRHKADHTDTAYIDGKVQFYGGSIGIRMGVVFGVEDVYDVYDFEYGQFSYGGIEGGIATPNPRIDMSATKYLGSAEGWASKYNYNISNKEIGSGIDNYSGAFLSMSASVSVGPVSVSVAFFTSPDSSIYGFTFGASTSINLRSWGDFLSSIKGSSLWQGISKGASASISGNITYYLQGKTIKYHAGRLRMGVLDKPTAAQLQAFLAKASNASSLFGFNQSIMNDIQHTYDNW